MKKLNLILIISLILNLFVIGNVMATENTKTEKPVSFTQDISNLPSLAPNEKVLVNPGETKAFKISKDGITYILEICPKIPQTTNDIASSATTGTGYAYCGINLYSDVGILLGTTNLQQSWNYSNGQCTYLPSPIMTDSVPWYSYPNYWQSYGVSGPTPNGSGQYVSQGVDKLFNGIPTPYGGWYFQACTCTMQLTIDGYGHWGQWTYYHW